MWWAIFENRTGALYSYGDTTEPRGLPAHLTSALALFELDELDVTKQWSVADRAFVDKIVVVPPTPAEKIDEILRSTVLSSEQDAALRAELEKLWGAM